jgi:hypothetical protein
MSALPEEVKDRQPLTLQDLRNTKQTITTYCIYFLFKEDQVIYIGQSRNGGFDRIGQHLNYTDKDFDAYTIMPCHESEINELEAEYILRLNPPYNKNIPYNAKYKSIAYIQSKYKQWNKDKLLSFFELSGIKVWLGKYVNIQDYLRAVGG